MTFHVGLLTQIITFVQLAEFYLCIFAGPAPNDYGNRPYDQQFRVQPDMYRRPPETSNGPLSPLRSQDPPHSEPIWPSSASIPEPYETTKFPYPEPETRYPDRYPMNNIYPDRMQRARTPNALDEPRYGPPPDSFGRARTPDALDDRRPIDRHRRAQTPDALDGRGYNPRPDAPARRAATPDNLDDRQWYPQDRYPQERYPNQYPNRYQRARTPEILDDRPKTLDNRYRGARTPEPLEPPRYYTIDNRQPLGVRSPESYPRSRTPDNLDGYIVPEVSYPAFARNGDFKSMPRQSSYAEPEDLYRVPAFDPYSEHDASYSRSSDNLDDVWGKMMQGDEDYENYIPGKTYYFNHPIFHV